MYQDINGKRDIGGDMMCVDLEPYDYIIATPPCNYWTYARGNRCSQYSKDTMHLLPDILNKLIKLDKPYIVENVRNARRFTEYGLLPRNDCYVYIVGRHTYWSNVKMDTSGIIQEREDVTNLTKSKRQGGNDVHNVIERFLQTIHERGREDVK